MTGGDWGLILGGVAAIIAALLGGGGIAKVLSEVRMIGRAVNHQKEGEPTLVERVIGLEASMVEHTRQDTENFATLTTRIDGARPRPGGRRHTDPPEESP